MDRIDRIESESLMGNQGRVLNIALTATVPTYQMKPGDTNIRVTSTEADGTGIIYLPSKAEAMGKTYYICAPTGATAGDISVAEKENETEITTYGDLDADDDHVFLYCDGTVWRVLKSGVA